MESGDRVETAIFGSVTIGAIYQTEAEARAGGYYADAHLKTGAWPDTAWKVLYNGEAFAAVRVMSDEQAAAFFTRPARKTQRRTPFDGWKPKKGNKDQVSLFDD